MNLKPVDVPMPSPAPQRLVLDTNVWLDLLHFEDPRCSHVATALADGRAVAVVNAPCRDEWLRVLAYPALRLDGAGRAALEARFDALATDCREHQRPHPWPTLPRCADPDDQKLLELACSAHASALLTRDRALLALARRTRRLALFDVVEPEDWKVAA